MPDKIRNMVLVLGTVAATFGAALAFVNAHTKTKIEARIFKESVLPTLNAAFGQYHANNDYLQDRQTARIGKDAMGRQIRADIYVARRNEKPVAMATTLNGRGYGGIFSVLLAADVQTHEIIAVRTLQQSETRGIGDRIADWGHPFTKQFLGKRIESNLALTNDGGEVDAMSGATITSAAFARTVQSASRLLLDQMRHGPMGKQGAR